ncbi:MAG TPA: PEP-CTERM sorting domain-containing protein [Verrucomicrobiota bacterium]|jgi:autotransporter-associated beta strand protein|nr:PEP-CTERM sorting domain-containing protein [Verrucomicrobiota bacterium]HQL80172.1 PEP-CTERM sorting domain-containing protein [Verrucomicrobiota bacterium]
MKREYSLLHNLGKLAAALSVAFAVSQAQAAMQWWDLNGTDTGAGGPSPSGVWDTTTANWTPGGSSVGTAATTTWVQANTAIFSAGIPYPGDSTGDYTITVADGIQVRNLRLYSGSGTGGGSTITFTGGSINMIGSVAGNFYVHSTGPQYVNVYSAISSDTANGLNLSRGAGNPVVTIYNPANSFFGTVNIRSTGMTLKMGAAGVIPTAVTSLASAGGGGILDLNGFSTAFDTAIGNVVINNLNAGQSFTIRNPAGETYSGAISGAGDVIKNGAGTITFSGNSTGFSGTVDVNAGTLGLTSTAGLGSGTIDLNGGALDVAGYTLGGSTKLTGNGTIAGTAMTANGTMTPGYAGTIGSFSAGTVALTLGGTLNMDIDAATDTADKISALSIAEGGTLNIQNIAGMLALGDTFDLFDGALSSTFSLINTPSLSDPDWYWDVTGLDAGGDGSIVVALVPEPSTAVCLGLGVAAMLILRRRKA